MIINLKIIKVQISNFIFRSEMMYIWLQYLYFQVLHQQWKGVTMVKEIEKHLE